MHKRAASTAAGSRHASSGRSKANPAPPAGDPPSADRACRDHRGTTPAAARTSSGPVRSGRATKTVLTPRSPAGRSAPGAGRAVPAWCRAAYVAAAVRPRSFSTRDQTSSRSSTDHGQVEHGHRDLGRVAPGGTTVPVQHLDLVLDRVGVEPDVAPVGQAGGDLHGPALATAADDDRNRADRARVAGRLGQRTRRRRTPWCRAPTAPAWSRSRARAGRAGRASPGRAARRRRARAPTSPRRGRRRHVLRTARRAWPRPSRSRQEGGTSPGDTACRAAAECRAPRACPSVTQGSGIGSHADPTCGIWIRWSISARPAKPDSSAAFATSRSQPAGSSPQGKRETCRTTSSPVWLLSASRGAGCSAAVGSAASASPPSTTVWTWSQLSLVKVVGHGAERLDLLGQHPGRDRPVTGSVAPAAQRRRGVERDHDRWQSGRARLRELLAPAYDVETQRVDDRRQSAAQPAGDDLVEQRERIRGRVEVVTAAADDRAQVVGGHDLGRAVALLRPRRLAGTRRPDEHDEGRVRKVRRRDHGGSLARSAPRPQTGWRGVQRKQVASCRRGSVVRPVSSQTRWRSERACSSLARRSDSSIRITAEFVARCAA